MGRKAVPWGSRGVQGSPAQGAEESRHSRPRPPFVLRLRRRGCGSALQGHTLPQPLREGRDPPGHEGPFAPHPPAPEQFNARSRRPRHAHTCPHTHRQNLALGMQHPRPHGKEGLGALRAAPGQSRARSCPMAENQGIDLNHAGLCWGAGPHGGTLGPGGDRQTDGRTGWYLSKPPGRTAAGSSQVGSGDGMAAPQPRVMLTGMPVIGSGLVVPASGSPVLLAGGSALLLAPHSPAVPAPGSPAAQPRTRPCPYTLWQGLLNRPPAQRLRGTGVTPLPPILALDLGPTRSPETSPSPGGRLCHARPFPGASGRHETRRQLPALGGPFVRRSQRSSTRKKEFLRRSNAFANWTPTSKQTRLPPRGQEPRGGEDPISSFVPGLLFFAGGEEAGERQGKGHKSRPDRRERRIGASCRWG